MIEKKLNDIQNDFSVMERCNKILFDNWKDNNAVAFNNSVCQDISCTCKSFLNEAQLATKEIKRMTEEIESQKIQLQKVAHEIDKICHFPDIQGCYICRATGHEMERRETFHHFILTKGEGYLIHDKEALLNIALVLCTGLKEVDDVCFVTNL